MAQVKLKEEPELWEPAEVDNSVGSEFKEDPDCKGVQIQHEPGPSLVHIKEEPEELKIKQEPLQEFPFIRVIVKSEDEEEEEESSLLHQTLKEENREDTDGGEPGLEKHSESESEEQSRGALVHTGESPFKCSVCEMDLQESALKVHMRTGERPFCCWICKRTFPYSCSLKQHMKSHTGEQFICSKCSETFSQKFSQKQKSSVCKKTFTRNSNLLPHMLVPEEKTYKCPVCKESFVQAFNLDAHMSVHKNKTFKCPVCMKTFSSRNHKNHMLVHTEKKPPSNQTKPAQTDPSPVQIQLNPSQILLSPVRTQLSLAQTPLNLVQILLNPQTGTAVLLTQPKHLTLSFFCSDGFQKDCGECKTY